MNNKSSEIKIVPLKIKDFKLPNRAKNLLNRNLGHKRNSMINLSTRSEFGRNQSFMSKEDTFRRQFDSQDSQELNHV